MDYSKMKKKDLIQLLTQREVEKVSSPDEAIKEIRKVRINYRQEHVILLVLNTTNHVLKRKRLFIGGLNESIIDMKIVLYEVLTTATARGLIIAHNHPSGSLTPSKEDCEFTVRCRDACKLVGLQMVDSIIITKTGSKSLKEEGII